MHPLLSRKKRGCQQRWAAACLCVISSTICLSADLTRVVFEGEAVPGVAGANAGFPTPLSVSANGGIVGSLDFSEPGTGTPRNMVFYAGSAGAALQKLITSGDAAPGSGGAVYTGHWDAFVSGGGQVLLDARFGSTKALMAGGPGGLTTVIYEGQSRPEVSPGAVVTSIPNFALNQSGDLGYLAYLSGNIQALWAGTAGGETLILKKDEDNLPGLPADASFALLEAMMMNDDGDICFSGSIRLEPMAPSIYDGLWKRSGGTISELLREGGSAPGGTWGQNPRFRSIANSGWSAFTASVSGNQGGLFVANGSSITRVLRHESGVSDAAPGTGGAAFVIDFNSSATSFQVSSTGRAMLRTNLQSGTGSPAVSFSTNAGIWAGTGGGLNLLVRKGDPAPGFDPSITLYNLFDSGMAADGRIYFAGQTSDFVSRLWVDDGNGNFTVVAQRGSTVDKPGGDVPIFNTALRSDLGNGADGRATLMTADGRVLMRVSEDGGSFSYGLAMSGAAGGGGEGSITGQVRQDLDGDGDFADAEDPPFAGAVLRLFADDGTGTLTPTGPELANVQPDAGDGYFEFTDVPVGTYVIVAEATASGFELSGPTGGKRVSVVTAETTDSGNDFLFAVPVSLSLLALHQDWLSGNSEDTSPLVPSADTALLVQQPELLPGGGLSADGVSPLVIKVLLHQHPVDRQLRWECSVESGGAVSGGIYSRMRSLVSGVWTPASDTGPHLLQPIAAGQPDAGTAFLSISPMEANEITLTTPDRELNLRLRIFDNVSGIELGSNLLPVKVRRPPVFLLASVPGETWGPDFLNGLRQSRAADHIRIIVADSTPLLVKTGISPYIEIDDLLADLGWNAEVDNIRQHWAMTRPDVIGHGRGGLMIQGLSLEGAGSGLDSYFRTSKNFGRGRYRRAIAIGTPFLTGYGIIPTYMFMMEKEIAALAQSNADNPIRLPELFKKVPSWQVDLTARPLLGRPIRDGGSPIRYDLLTRIHLIASRIDSVNSEAFPLIGFTPLAQSVLTPEGTDGVVSVTDALLGNTGFLSMTTLPGHIAHGEDRALFNNVPIQTNSTAAAERSVFILDQAGPQYFLTAHDLKSVDDGGDVTKNIEALVEGLKIIVRQTLNSHTATLEPVMSGGSVKSERNVDRGFTTSAASSQVVEIQPPGGAAVTAGPYWYAEVFGPDGVTSAGVTLTPDEMNPNRVTVDIDGSVVGDVILYASYLAGDTTVFAPPLKVASIEPPSVTATSLTLLPSSTVLDLDNEITPALWVNYSDGSTLRRWVHPDDIMVSSSSPGVVNVSNETQWQAASEGQSIVTLTYGGLSAQSVVRVVDSTSLRTYDQWKSVMFDPDELSDAAISGDNADFDKDGIHTFWEFITGGDPRHPDRNHLPRIANVDLGAGSRPALIVRIARRVTGESIDIERSGNLSFWTDLLHWPDATPDETGVVLKVREFEEYYEVWLDIGHSLDGRQFFRFDAGNVGAPAES